MNKKRIKDKLNMLEVAGINYTIKDFNSDTLHFIECYEESLECLEEDLKRIEDEEEKRLIIEQIKDTKKTIELLKEDIIEEA